MRNIKLTLAFCLLFVLPFTAGAQDCPFDISVETINHACIDQCGIKVTLTAGGGSSIILDHPTNGAQLRIVQVVGSTEVDLGSASVFANWPVVNEGGILKKTYYSLNGGNYRVYARALCQGGDLGNWVQAATSQDFTIINNYQLPSVTYYARKTMNCRATGQIKLTISQGVAPYTVAITAKPSSYTGTISWSPVAAGVHDIDNLPGGDYTIVTTDACGNSYTHTNIKVDTIPRDIPASPINVTLRRSSSANTSSYNSCLLVRQNSTTSVLSWEQDVLWYWLNSKDYYEWRIFVGSSRNDAGGTWIDITNPDILGAGVVEVNPASGWYLIPNTNEGKNVGDWELPAKYVSYGGFCDSKDSVFLVVRTLGTGCGQMQYTPFNTSTYVCNTGLTSWTVRTRTGSECNKVKLQASAITVSYGVCYPATWQVVDTTGIAPSSYVFGVSGTVLDFGTLSGISGSGLQITSVLEFIRKTYIIRIIGGDGRIMEKVWTAHDPPLAEQSNYAYITNGWFGQNTLGLPTCSRYFGLRPYADDYFWPGSTIKYVSFTSSPASCSAPPVLGMGPVGSVYTIPANQYSFYPNSPAPHTSAVNAILPAGTYKFEVWAPFNCKDEIRTYNFVLGAYYQPPLAIDYEKQITCNGMRIYLDTINPGTTVTSGDYSNRIRMHCSPDSITSYITTYWRILSGPPGYSTAPVSSATAINTSTYARSLLLPIPGKYVIATCYANGATAEPMFTTEVEFFEEERLSLKATDISSYICGNTTTGNIFIVAKGGVPFQTSPTFQMYRYTIVDDETNEQMYQGFNAAHFGFESEGNKKYRITVEDGCTSQVVTVTMLDLANASIAWYEDNGIFCVGSKIKIHSVALGDPNVVQYVWWRTTPHPYIEYYGKDPDIDATLTNSGRYYITVIPENCAEAKTDSIDVVVHQVAPALPTPSPVTACRSSSSTATVNLVALSGVTPTVPNGVLQWYDSNMLPTAPPIAVSIYNSLPYGGGQYTYYVSQVAPDLCSSDPVPVILNVVANCETAAASVLSPTSVCIGGTSTIRVTNQTGVTFGPVLWGGYSQATTMPIPLITATNSDGTLVIRFNSDGSGQNVGASMFVSCADDGVPVSGGQYLIPSTGSNTIATCSGMVVNETEPVLSGDYTYLYYKNYSNGYLVVNPAVSSPPGTKVSTWGIINGVEANYDYYTVYDGITAGGSISGYWVSNNPDIAVVLPGTTVINGTYIEASVQGIAPGTATFSYVCGNGTFTTGYFSVVIHDATISYPNSGISCRPASGSETTAVNRVGTTGGVYSISPAATGVSINSSTGAVTLTSDAVLGSYTITYNIAAGVCPAFSTTTTITVTGASSIAHTASDIPVNMHLMARFPCIPAAIGLFSAAGSDDQTQSINTPIDNVVYTVTGATDVAVLCLPPGVTGVWEHDVLTLQGSPSALGTFTYTVTATGSCGTPATITGTITVDP